MLETSKISMLGALFEVSDRTLTGYSKLKETAMDEITLWISKLKENDPRSHEELWNAYFQALLGAIRKKLNNHEKRSFDEEDVAVSAFHSFFRAVEEQRIPQLNDRHDLWKVIIVIAARKISNRRDRNNAQKRGGGQVRGESVFLNTDRMCGAGLGEVMGDCPSPEMIVESSENLDRLLGLLDDPVLLEIAQLKLEGYSNHEISVKTDRVERTVERKLERIRKIWTDAGEQG